MKAADLTPGETYMTSRSNNLRNIYGQGLVEVIKAPVTEYTYRRVGYFGGKIQANQAVRAWRKEHPDTISILMNLLTEKETSWQDKAYIDKWKVTAYGPAAGYRSRKDHALVYYLDRDTGERLDSVREGEEFSMGAIPLQRIKMSVSVWKTLQEDQRIARAESLVLQSARKERITKLTADFDPLLPNQVKFQVGYVGQPRIVFRDLDEAETFMKILRDLNA